MENFYRTGAGNKEMLHAQSVRYSNCSRQILERLLFEAAFLSDKYIDTVY